VIAVHGHVEDYRKAALGGAAAYAVCLVLSLAKIYYDRQKGGSQVDENLGAHQLQNDQIDRAIKSLEETRKRFQFDILDQKIAEMEAKNDAKLSKVASSTATSEAKKAGSKKKSTKKKGSKKRLTDSSNVSSNDVGIELADVKNTANLKEFVKECYCVDLDNDFKQLPLLQQSF